MSTIERVGVRRGAALIVIAMLGVLLAVPASVAPARADGNEAPGAPAAFRSITAGGFHTCARLDDGTVKCWGNNTVGQLGLGDTNSRGNDPGEMANALPTVDFGAGRTATAITAGVAHTCALLDNATVKCWGTNTVGQLGLGDTNNRGDNAAEMGDDLPTVSLGTGRTATAITAGGFHTCARLDDATVKCWGFNAAGQLGLGDTNNRGDNAAEMGDDLPTVSLGTGRTATAITAGTFHTCARLDDGSVKCWGDNFSGQLGLGDTNSRGDNAGEMGDDLPTVSLGTGRTATAATAGDSHTCALLDNATVKCWGTNTVGQLGLGDTNNRGDNAAEMGDDLPTVSLGTGRTATAITAGNSHACARLDDATVKCWGHNASGQLGLGDTNNRGDDAAEMGDDLPTVSLGTGRTATAVSAGAFYTCARLDDATVKCWGNNIDGQLGLGDINNRGDGPGEMGDALPAPIILRAAVTAAVTADQASVIAGGVIDYHVTITNIGGIPLTSVNVSAPDVPDCAGPTPNLALGASTVVDCSYTTTADDVPQMTNQVLVTTGQDVLALSGTRRTRVDAQVFRPDGQIRLGNGAFAGTTTYNTTGTDQTRSATVPNRGTATFTARIQNDGNTTDSFTVRGQATTNRYTVTYRDGPTNITTAVAAGSFTLADLDPGETHDITIRIKARTGTPSGNTISRTLTTRSTNSPSTRDVVKATVRRR